MAPAQVRPFDLFPRRCAITRCHVLAMGFEDGRTRIAVSAKPRETAMRHARLPLNAPLAWVHLSEVVSGIGSQRLLRSIAERASLTGKRFGSTYLFDSGLRREQAVRCVREAIADVRGGA